MCRRALKQVAPSRIGNRSGWGGWVVILICGFAFSHAPAQMPLSTLSTLAEITALENAQAKAALPVDFKATVIYSRGFENLLFVQEGPDAIFVRPPDHRTLKQGDRIRIQGKTQNSFRPIVVSDRVTLVEHVLRPKAVTASFWDLIKADLDCHLVVARGRVRSADANGLEDGRVQNSRLQLVTDGGHFEVDVDSADQVALKNLLDAEVEVTGVAAGKFDDKMQQTGAVVYVSGLEDVRVLKRAAEAPRALPITPMDRILEGHRVTDTSSRVRVHGTITYYQPSAAVVLQDGNKSLWIETHTHGDLKVGDQAYATGFPAEHDRILTLADGEIEDLHVPGIVQPLNASWKQLAFWSSNSPIGHENDLVSIEGRVVTMVREASQDEYVLNSDGKLFSAIFRHAPDYALPMPSIPAGAKVRVTGICTIADMSAITPGQDVPFQILLRDSDDVVMIANPPLLSIRNLVILAGLLLLVTALAIAWGWSRDRKVHRQADAIALLEQRRSAILEGINSSRPLADVLEQVTELVSSSLHGAACWIEVADGARLGRVTAEDSSRRVIAEEVTGHAGGHLGTLHAVVPEQKSEGESQAMQMGVRLAVLAIETHGLYQDLTYRSEFDALTDAHNRFSLDRCLDEMVRNARGNASVFGLIYIDLDHFKQVNDLFGHRVGDLYLQEVSSRMKRQLRPGDMLARLGGDEFAILVPHVRNRAGVEEIARRLEGCFSSPIELEGHALRGSASVGVALYPEDGRTSDAILNAADGAMYEKKKAGEAQPRTV